MICLVVQGPVGRHSFDWVSHVREHCPLVTSIVLSTWPSSVDLNMFELFDDVVVTKDPGSNCDDFLTLAPDNFRRQRQGVLAVRDRVAQPFIIKMRTDCEIDNAKKFKKFTEFLCSNEYIYYVGAQGSVDPMRFPILMHFSDIVLAGKSEKVFDLYFASDTKFDGYLRVKHFIRHNFFGLSGFRWARLACEQRLWVGDKFSDFYYESFSYSVYKKHISLASSIFIFDEKEYGIFVPERIGIFSSFAPYFFRPGNPYEFSYFSFLCKRFSVVMLSRYVKSISSIAFFLAPRWFRKRLFKKHIQ